MRKLQCEACGSNEIVKIADDMFECKYCGLKYTLATVRSLIIEEDVKVKPTDFQIVAGELVKYNGSDTSVVIPNGVGMIGEKAFAGLAIEKVVIPSGVRMVKTEAFKDCKYLKEVDLSNTIIEIAPWAFAGCAIETIVIPSSVQRIDNCAFAYCKNLKSVEIKNLDLLNHLSTEWFGMPEDVPDCESSLWLADEQETKINDVNGKPYKDIIAKANRRKKNNAAELAISDRPAPPFTNTYQIKSLSDVEFVSYKGNGGYIGKPRPDNEINALYSFVASHKNPVDATLLEELPDMVKKRIIPNSFTTKVVGLYGHYIFTDYQSYSGGSHEERVGYYKECITNNDELRYQIKLATEKYLKECWAKRICPKCGEPMSYFGKCPTSIGYKGSFGGSACVNFGKRLFNKDGSIRKGIEY